MNSIERSGLYQNDVGESFLVTQGLVGYTLVAGKQILFRLFLDQAVVPLVDYVVVTINGAGKTIGVFVTKAYLIVENDLPNGPSVGVVLKGFAFPKAGVYSVTIVPYTNQGAPLAQPTLLSMNFLPTKDLRFLVNYMYHEGVFGPTPDWDTDVYQSMLRLGSMFPVRDCVQSELNGDTRHGLRYTLGNSCDGWTDTYYKCVYEQTKAINAAAGDDVDVTIEFRWGLYAPQWNPPGDPSPGGNSGRPPAPYNNLPRAGCVAGPWNGLEMTAPCFGQEIGHNFGLEPAGSPHFQDLNDPGHSKDAHINDVYAFDFVNMRPFNPPPANHFLGDVMNNLGAGAGQGRDLVLFNAYDWEYLRGQFVLLNSTGTEINPAYTYVCGPHVQPKAVPPATWTKVITGQAGGPLITWGPHGIHVGPPPRPDRRLASVTIDGLLLVLGELRKRKVGAAYLPYADQPFPIVGSTPVATLHHADFNFGGVADKRR